MSDINEIKPHPNGAEYIIEDVPAEPTPKNRPSAILFNWMIRSINKLTTTNVYSAYKYSTEAVTLSWNQGKQLRDFYRNSFSKGNLVSYENGNLLAKQKGLYKITVNIMVNAQTKGDMQINLYSGGIVRPGAAYSTLIVGNYINITGIFVSEMEINQEFDIRVFGTPGTQSISQTSNLLVEKIG